jgi:hypothetical protein
VTFRKLQFVRDKFQGDKIISYSVFRGNTKYKWTDINSSRHVFVCLHLWACPFIHKASRFSEFYSDKLVIFSVLVSTVIFCLFLMLLFRILLGIKETFVIEVPC